MAAAGQEEVGAVRLEALETNEAFVAPILFGILSWHQSWFKGGKNARADLLAALDVLDVLVGLDGNQYSGRIHELFEENELLDFVEELQMHEDETVYEKAVGHLERFWSEEDADGDELLPHAGRLNGPEFYCLEPVAAETLLSNLKLLFAERLDDEKVVEAMAWLHSKLSPKTKSAMKR